MQAGVRPEAGGALPFVGAVPASIGRRLLAGAVDAAVGAVFGGAFTFVGVSQALGAVAAGDPPTTGPLIAAGMAVLLAFLIFQCWCEGNYGVTAANGLRG